MKRIIISILVLCSFVVANAQHDPGFRVFLDAEYVLSCTEISDGYNKYDLSNRVGGQVTAGMQFTEQAFAGIGIGYQNFHEGSAYCLPIYADVRYDFAPKDNTFFIDAKVGYSVGDFEGFYLNPSVGYRIGLGNNLGLNLGVGYLLQSIKDLDGTTGDITFKIGIDF